MLLWIPSLLLLCLGGVEGAVQCYYRNGGVANGDFPCLAEDPTFCCENGFICASGGLCLRSDFVNASSWPYSYGTCTDRSWNSPLCPQLTCAPQMGIINCGNGAYCCSPGSSNMSCCNGPSTVSLGTYTIIRTLTPEPPQKSPATTASGPLTTQTTSPTIQVTHTSSQTPTLPPKSSPSLSVGAKAGISVGVVVGVTLATALAIVVFQGKKRERALRDQLDQTLKDQLDQTHATYGQSEGRVSELPGQ